MSASKVLVGCWLGLALLSITTVLLGSAGSTLLLGGTILLVALGKAWLITEASWQACATRLRACGACCCSPGRC
ncbi:hypothetical protein SSTU70S_01787 [Stutzerimonas stutzeri]